MLNCKALIETTKRLYERDNQVQHDIFIKKAYICYDKHAMNTLSLIQDIRKHLPRFTKYSPLNSRLLPDIYRHNSKAAISVLPTCQTCKFCAKSLLTISFTVKKMYFLTILNKTEANILDQTHIHTNFTCISGYFHLSSHKIFQLK